MARTDLGSQKVITASEIGLASFGNANHLVGETVTVLNRPTNKSTLVIDVEVGTFRTRLGDYSQLGNEVVSNPDFADDVDWTLGDGWSISGGTASSDGSQSSTSDLSIVGGLLEGETYTVSFEITAVTAGTVTPGIGGTSGTARSTVATYTEDIVAGAGGTITLTASVDFVGSVDDVSVKKAVMSYEAPSASHTGGFGSIKLREGRTLAFTAPEKVTVAGSSALDVLTYYWV